MEIKAKFGTVGNTKLGDMGTFSKLYGSRMYNTCLGAVLGSCGDHCKGCERLCYVGKSYRYASVINGHARNTLAFRMDIKKAFEDLNNQINRKRKPFKVIRINQSGEIESFTELFCWMLLAQMHPEIQFYLYTKNFEAVRELTKSAVPSNLTILISVWHEYGIPEFLEFKKYPYIKAFVYMDGFDYTAYGLEVETMCTAYDVNGKMDHRITCDKCKKCFNSKFQIIGCFDH